MQGNLDQNIGKTLKIGVIAGLAGGAAEVVWISLLSVAGGTSAAEVARGVTAAIAPVLATSTSGVALGLAIHMVLAGALGAVFYSLWVQFMQRHFSSTWVAPFAFTTLAVVWAVNFHLVLPIISPNFIVLVPPVLGLISKLLFAVALLVILRRARSARPQATKSANTGKRR